MRMAFSQALAASGANLLLRIVFIHLRIELVTILQQSSFCDIKPLITFCQLEKPADGINTFEAVRLTAAERASR
jgi:hypothetical protein